MRLGASLLGRNTPLDSRTKALGHRRLIITGVGRGMLALGILISAGADAVLASFAVRVEDDLRIADVQVIDRDNVAYVSLVSLVTQIGGACNVTPERVQVDLAAKAASLKLNSPEATGSRGRFLLDYPVIEKGDDALVALSDIPSLFEKAFGFSARQDTTQAPAAPAPEPAPEAPPAESAPTPRAVRVVILDPGHGGQDTGAEGLAGTKESDVVLAVAQKVRQLLEKDTDGRLKAMLTRDQDRDCARKERIVFATSNKGDLLISIHTGAGFAPAATGFEIFCLAPEPSEARPASKGESSGHLGAASAAQSLALAQNVENALREATGAEDRGVHQVPCAVTMNVPMAGVLIEVGVLTNATEETLLQADAYQETVAQGIVAGIRKYAESAGGTGR